MPREKTKTYEATIKRNGRGWNIDVDGVRIGSTDSLANASRLLFKQGYKTYAFRYTPTNDTPGWRATVIKRKDDE
jgi:hypothetical protein